MKVMTFFLISFSLLTFESFATDESAVPGVNTPIKMETIKQVKDARYKQLVEFSANIQKIKRDNDLVVEDSTGKVNVDVNEMPLPLKKGDKITVIGRVDRDWGTEIYATRIIAGETNVSIPRSNDE